jgi:hypothetical protein
LVETAAAERPGLLLPEAEAAFLRDGLSRADVILEYGSGGSTLLAAGLPGRGLFSVESDAAFADRLRGWLAADPPRREVVLHHVDIGRTSEWGYPEQAGAWRRFHRYPTTVWDRHDFLHPDTVLIDGRFRAACFLTVLFRCERPVSVFWDDYADRPAYHEVERLCRPAEVVGRMARFDLTPTTLPPRDLTWVMDVFTRAH